MGAQIAKQIARNGAVATKQRVIGRGGGNAAAFFSFHAPGHDLWTAADAPRQMKKMPGRFSPAAARAFSNEADTGSR
jgi:hypothetical protein